MDNILEFDIQFDENFHIIIETNQDDIPEPFKEEYFIIELDEIFTEENNNHNNLRDRYHINILNNRYTTQTQHMDMTINEQINTGEDLLNFINLNIRSNFNLNEIITDINNLRDDNENKKIEPNQLEEIPTEIYEENQIEENKCSICYTKYNQNDLLRKLKCNHTFHKCCLDNWLLNYNNKCPFCKNKI